MAKPKGGRAKEPAPDWSTVTNERRKRPMVTLTLAPETLALLDAMKGERSRGELIDELVAHARKKSTRGA